MPTGAQQEHDPEPLSFFRRKGEEQRTALAPGLAPGKVVGDFRLVALIGQGGMGQVWEAEQVSLQRIVAVKFVRPERVTEHQLELFAREARAGGRLSHPGIVGVHGHGTSDGLAWIAMEHVEGAWTLRDFLDEVVRAETLPEGYDRQVARLAAEIAEALQVAHASGVIHRDVKPQNVLITADDHPKVSDFGLARITDESALSVTGDFAGTYFYMSPEQVAAKRAGIDHRTDVFSLGVVLYELLALRRPFQGDTEHQVAAQVLAKDPPDVRTLRSRVPRDLAVIVGKALEKDRDKRFQTMAELAADLRRFLADQPILARPPTRLDRAVKWVKRNPAKSMAAAITLIAFGVISALLVANVRANRALARKTVELAAKTDESEGRRAKAEENEQRALAGEALAEERRIAAEESAERERQRADEVLRLSALQRLDDLVAEADRLWPAHPELVPRYEEWLSEARELLAELPDHERKLAELRGAALPWTEEEQERHRAEHPKSPELEKARREFDHHLGRLGIGDDPETDAEREQELVALERRIEALQAELAVRQEWRFARTEDRWWHGQLEKLVDGLRALADPEQGLCSGGISEEHGAGLERRLEFARTIGERSVTGSQASAQWAEARASIANASECPAYRGMRISPQLGLLPIGRDPDSKLWEFAHLQTGAPALRDADGALVLTPDTGLVLVLLPGGRFLMGAQRTDPHGANYDPEAKNDEGPVHEVELAPFFLSKYEMTQGQWERLTGKNPSQFGPERYSTIWNREGRGWSALHPVEQVSWVTCMETLGRLGLSLPSEAQWEYGARAGSGSVYGNGDEPGGLQGVANLSDAYGRSHGHESWPVWEPWLDDGQTVHAEVGTYRGNAFGLHEVQGNVWEWCLDGYLGSYSGRGFERDPVSAPTGPSSRVTRGGGFNNLASYARCANRGEDPPELADTNLGLRPARAVLVAK